jgi:hypothetical protein
MGYWAALDLPRTRFVVHYDADMLLHQDAGFDWTAEAFRHWADRPEAVAAAPRISPPGFAAVPIEDAPSRHEGRPLTPVAGGWLNDWFSTRCFLIDRGRLAGHLPLISGPQAWRWRLRRFLGRGYPPSPEAVLSRRLGPRGGRCLHLATERAWLLHPQAKNAEFLQLLPGIIAAVAEGQAPAEQRGRADLRIDAWRGFLRQARD